MKISLLFIIAALFCSGIDACQSCLAELTRGLLLGEHKHEHKHHVKHQHFAAAGSLPLSLRKPILNGRGLDVSVIRFLTIRKCIAAALYERSDVLNKNSLVTQQPTALTQQQQHLDSKNWLRRILFASDNKELDDSIENDKDEEADVNASSNSGSDEVMSSSMIMAIGFYKKFISPLLPPACRFLPTCSQYGVQAIEKFGPTKGLVLTAWRLARCSPFGGKGYDPPIWPPVPYWYGSY